MEGHSADLTCFPAGFATRSIGFATLWPAAASTEARKVLHGKLAAECEEIEAVGLFV